MTLIHFTWHLWECLLHMTSSTNPRITSCRPSPAAGHSSLSHQISPRGRQRREVKRLCSECTDLWTPWPVHTWVSVCVTVCDSKGLTKECMQSAGTKDNWAICCKVTADQTPNNLVLSAALTSARLLELQHSFGPFSISIFERRRRSRKRQIYSRKERSCRCRKRFFKGNLLNRCSVVLNDNTECKTRYLFYEKMLGNIAFEQHLPICIVLEHHSSCYNRQMTMWKQCRCEGVATRVLSPESAAALGFTLTAYCCPHVYNFYCFRSATTGSGSREKALKSHSTPSV